MATKTLLWTVVIRRPVLGFGVLDRNVLSAHGGKGLAVGDREDPGGQATGAVESFGPVPDCEHGVIENLLDQGRPAGHVDQKPGQPRMVGSVQRFKRAPVAPGDPGEQRRLPTRTRQRRRRRRLADRAGLRCHRLTSHATVYVRRGSEGSKAIEDLPSDVRRNRALLNQANAVLLRVGGGVTSSTRDLSSPRNRWM